MASSLEDTSLPPSAFYCPISLELMTDPVTLPSGITYDRASIQSWFAAGHLTCPVTRLPLLPYPFFIPNHTLLRIIRSWRLTHSHSRSLSSQPVSHSDRVRIPQPCSDALLKLGLLDSTVAELLPHDQATPLLISLISHYAIDACQGHAFAEHTCDDALATLSLLPLSPHHLTCLSQPHILPYLSSHFLHSSHLSSRKSSALLLTKLISQHPSQKQFLQNLSPELFSALASGLAQILKESDTSSFLVQDILHSLCLLCKSSRTALLSLADANTATLAHVALEQLLHSARRGATPISEEALGLLEILASCAEGRDAIASHAFAVPTIARFLERSVSEAEMGAAVVVLWKMCRYSSRDRVRRQAMEACVPSKLVLIMQARQLSSRGKKKAGALVRLLIEKVI